MRPFLSEQQLGEPFTGLPDTMVVFRSLEFYYRDGEKNPPKLCFLSSFLSRFDCLFRNS